jgi:hypothetical protein
VAVDDRFGDLSLKEASICSFSLTWSSGRLELY